MTGCIDIYGHASTTGSHLLCGWASVSSSDTLPGYRHLTLVFEYGSLSGEALVAGTLRDDLGSLGSGVVVHFPASDTSLGALLSATIEGHSGPVMLEATGGTERSGDAALVERLRAQRLAPDGIGSQRFQAVLERPGYEGRDTLDRLDGLVAFRIDEAIATGRTDMLLNGWLMNAPDALRAIRLRSGRRSTPILVDRGVQVERPDVMAKHAAPLRSRQTRCGFILPLADCLEPGEPCFVEIETSSGEIGYTRVAASRLHGLAAIRNALANLSPRYDQVEPVFDRLGPSLAAMNADRLSVPPGGREVTFGRVPETPVCSVIVPLYGRMDYMEVQVALFATRDFARRHELIYVVDDPANTNSALQLADSLFRRFDVPIRLLLMDENVGFAPACNAGLAMAHGRAICFLNSDVFGHTPDWLDHLVADLDRDQTIGIVGPLLLFEDGSVQHQGMGYAPLPEFGGWLFPTHPGKGLRPTRPFGMVRESVITGACMVMSRDVARRLDGFDTGYVVGDFEDSDLCLRARDLGINCAIDHAVRLYHLERKSQASAAEPWRMNVTLYNAWQHQRRWAHRLPGFGLIHG